MEPESSRILGIVLYKIISLGVGALSLGFGYKLFMAGVVATAGNLEASGKGMKLKLKNGAPGTFFALFGAIIISYTIGKGIAMSGEKLGGTAGQTESVSNAAMDSGEAPSNSNDISKSALYNESDDNDQANPDSPVASNENQDEPQHLVLTDVVYGTVTATEDTAAEKAEEPNQNN